MERVDDEGFYFAAADNNHLEERLMAEETDAEYAARLGLEPPSDPVVAKQWWADFAFHARAQWPAEVTARLITDGGAMTINRIPPEPFPDGKVEMHSDGGGATIYRTMTREQFAEQFPADANHMRR
jgi:hypothetical protein